MKDFHVRMFKNNNGETLWFNGFIEDLLKTDPEDIPGIPSTGGTYILGTTDGTMLTYPWGTSPIFYIGKANNLKRRIINDHRNSTLKVVADHDEKWWKPIYQYGAAFGVDMAWYSVKGTQSPTTLETNLIDQFYEAFGAIPVANGQWPNGIGK